MKNQSRITMALMGILLGTSIGAHGAVVADYDFTGGASASADSDLTTTASAFNISNQPGAAFASNRAQVNYSFTDPTFSGYFDFDVTVGTLPNPSDKFRFESITFDYFYQNAANANAFVSLFASSDGFTGLNPNVDTPLYSFTPGTTNNGTEADINVSLSAFELLSPTEDLSFRFYFRDGFGSPSRIHGIDNIVVLGEIAPVPEPSTIVLLGIGGLLLGLRRRK